MIQAFYTGITGIQANTTGIDIISDNIANISTVGFKGNDYQFASTFEKYLNTDSANVVGSSIGTGVGLSSTPIVEAVGNMIPTDRSTDLAILGDGWFGMQTDGERIFTRDGSFTFDANTNLVSGDGFHVLGTMGNNISADNILTATINTLKLGDADAQEILHFPKDLTFPPKPTQKVQFFGNISGELDQIEIGNEKPIRIMGASAIDPLNNKNNIQLKFSKSEVQVPPGIQWDVVAQALSLDGKTVFDTQTGVANFDSTGALISTTLKSIDNNGSEVEIDLGSNFNGIIAIANSQLTSSSISDGTIGGDLVGYDININGEVVATFTNGEQSSVGKIAIFHFQNNQGLSRVTGSRFQQTSNSGDAIFYKDAKGDNVVGTAIQNFTLEGSNVTMSYGLTELIILQRAYDANAKSITTADQMMQKALNMDA